MGVTLTFETSHAFPHESHDSSAIAFLPNFREITRFARFNAFPARIIHFGRPPFSFEAAATT